MPETLLLNCVIDGEAYARIKGMESCWALQKTRTRDGESSWESYKWFKSFGNALEEAVHHDIRTHPAASLSEAIEAVSSLVRRYELLIPSKYRLTK